MEDFQSLKATELTLRLPGADARDTSTPAASLKRTFSQVIVDEETCSHSSSIKLHTDQEKELDDTLDDAPAPPKAQVVGWPPVRAHMMLSYRARKKEGHEDQGGGVGIYVKVSMDGAPYLRKVDLKVCKGYKDLREALEIMFNCVSLGKAGHYDGSDYAITYEDKDGDWMLVGDVPWEMFISSCKRMRIMKGAEARGLSNL